MRRTGGYWTAVTSLLLVAYGLRVFRLDFQAASGDDANRLLIGQHSLAEILQLDRHDPHPPLPFILQHFWQAPAGMSEFAGRYLPALFAMLAVAALFRLALSLGGRWLGLAVLALSAVNLFLLGFAQEVVPYSQLVFAVTASCYLQWRVVRGAAVGHWMAYVAAAILALYSHYFAVFVLLAQNVAVLVLLLGRRLQWRFAPAWVAAQAAVVASCVPLLFLSTILGSYGNDLVRRASLSDMAGSLIGTFSGGLPRAATVMVAGVILAGFVEHRSAKGPAPGWPGWRAPAAWLVVCWLLAPVLAVFVASLYRPMFFERYMVIALPPFTLAVAAGVLVVAKCLRPALGPLARMELLSPAAGALAVAAMSLPSVARLPAYYGKPVYASSGDIRSLLTFVRDSAQPDAAFVVNLPVTDPMYQYYAPAQPTFFIPNPPQGRQAAAESQLSQVLGSHSEVWFTPWDYDHTAFVEHWLDQHAYRVDQHWFANAEIIRYERPRQAGQFQPASATFVAPTASIRLTGYQFFGTQARPGEPIMFALQWQADGTLAERYKVFVHLVDPAGRTVTQRDDEPVANTRPTTSWKPGETITDNYGLVVPRGAPAGDYHVYLGLYKLEGLQRLRLADGTDHAVLGPIAVKQ